MEKQLIFVYDKKRDAYVDKTTEITDVREQGSYMIVYFGSTKSFRYRKENIRFYPLVNVCQQVRIFHNGKVQEQYDTLYDYGEYVKLGNDDEICSLAIKKSEIEISEILQPEPDAEHILLYFEQLLQEEPTSAVESSNDPSDEKDVSEESNLISDMLISALQGIDRKDTRTAFSSYLSKRVHTHEINSDKIIYPFGCNESQKLATQRALSNNVSIIEGPPGTGKTQTILNIVANLLMQGKTVGIVSNNNAAVDNVREKLTKYGYGALIAELGNKVNRQLFFNTKQTDFVPKPEWNLTNCDRNTAIVRFTELSAHIDELFRKQNELASLRTRLADAECEYLHLQKEQPVTHEQKQQIDHIFLRRFDSRRALLFRHFIITKYSEYGRISLWNRIELLFRFGVIRFRQLFRQVDLLADYANHKFYQTLIDEITEKINEIERWLQGHDVDKINKEYTDLSVRLFQNKLFHKYEKLNDEITQSGLTFSLDDYKRNFEKFTERYPIILSTTYSLSGSVGYGHLLDYVIIDESSQVNVITAAICCAYCRNIVIIGDSRQLPHIVDEKLMARSLELRKQFKISDAYDYLRQNILSSFKLVFSEKIPITMLREHYRCHPAIINFCNRKYYRGRLLIMTRSDDPCPFQVLTTTPSKTYANKGRIYNQRQIDATSNWLNNISDDSSHIGIISPYRYHAEMARQSLSAGIEVDTIHKFQGREKDVIVFHTVRPQTTAFLDNPNLINVAVSRAVRKLVVVKTAGMKILHGSDIGDLLRYIRFTSVNDSITFIDSQVRSVFDILHTEYTSLQRAFKSSKDKQSPAEYIIDQLLIQILAEQDKFSAIGYHSNYRLCELIGRNAPLSDEERSFVQHGSHLDFLLYNRMDRSPILGIEVDGVVYHRFNEKQGIRDQKKDHIMELIGIPLLRLSTDGSNEKDRIVYALEQAMQQYVEDEADRAAIANVL